MEEIKVKCKTSIYIARYRSFKGTKDSGYIRIRKKEITRRTTTSERDKFLQVIASFRNKKIQIACNI